MNQNNRRIALNTSVMYLRLIITTIIGLITSRYVLLALGANDYGLLAVVGGLISMLNILSAAMHTTTRRFINIEMGNPDGNLNRIFNVSLVLHIGFALFILILAETFGMFYIYNYLKVDPGKFNDAIFVFQVSALAVSVSIINVPYQALLESFEKFSQVAVADIVNSIIKVAFVVSLMYLEGNILKIYIVGISSLTLLYLAYYYIACFCQWKEIVTFRLYKGYSQYKEILFFNNYVAMGATSYIARTQASAMLVNFFFGTLVNAAFAIGYTIENYCMTFVSNIGTAASPQITQNYFENYDRSVMLTEALNRYTIYLMLFIIVPLFVDLDFILSLWLKNVPEGAVIVTQLTLLSALSRVLFGGMDKIIQASGKIKWFQTYGSIIEISCIPVGYIGYKLGAPAEFIIILFIICTILGCAVNLYLLKRILNFDVFHYAQNVFYPAFKVISFCIILILFYKQLNILSSLGKILGIFSCLIFTMLITYIIGIDKNERILVKFKISQLIRKL